MPPVSLPDLASALISALESNTANTVATELPTTFDVLIAEDNPVNQKLAQRFLEKYSHGVEIAENGLLAVEAYKARAEQGRRFDAVLVSLGSPDGYVIGLTRVTDGCVHAVHGRVRSDTDHSTVRAGARIRSCTHHCVNRTCQ